MVLNMVNFILFGAGMAVPLILLSALSSLRGNEVTRFLADHKRTINIVTGILMIAVAGYYLLTFVGMQG
jgi:cytochrome c biogenesis protein CcdA